MTKQRRHTVTKADWNKFQRGDYDSLKNRYPRYKITYPNGTVDDATVLPGSGGCTVIPDNGKPYGRGCFEDNGEVWEEIDY